MIMMMTDPDRVALSAFLPAAFLFRFIRPIHPFMPASTPTLFRRNVPPAICHTSYYPHPFHIAATLFSSRQHLARPSITSLPLFAQYLSAGLVPFLPLLTPKQPTTNTKKLAIRVTPLHPPLILCKSARVTRTCVRLSMYLLPVAVFISHQKEGFDRDETGAQKKPFVVSNTLS
jgi:hypothetical protein